MTTLAAMYAAFDAATTPVPAPEPFVPELPAATAPHGPRARPRPSHSSSPTPGHHSHLVAYGETVCLTGQCGPALDALRGLL